MTKQLDWHEVREEWKDREEKQITGWAEHFTEKGFPPEWNYWRQSIIEALGLPDRTWYLSQASSKEVGQMHCNALTGWRRFYDDRRLSTFTHLSSHPFFQRHSKIKGLRENFPEKPVLITLTDGHRKIVIDGHHEALTLAKHPYLKEEINLHEAFIKNQAEFQRIFEGHWWLFLRRLIIDERIKMDYRMRLIFGW